MTDQNGDYTINSALPDRYTIYAEGGVKGIYLKQWYDQIQPQRDESSLGYFGYYYDNEAFRDAPSSHLTRSGLTGFTNRILEFKIRNYASFSLSLDVMTASGNPAKIKFYNHYDYHDDTLQLISNIILVPLGDYQGYYNTYSSYNPYVSTRGQKWTRFQYDLKEILEDYLSAQFDRVTGITIRGGVPYFIDYVKMTEEGKGDQVIEDFDYSDSPLSHGWGSDAYFDFASIQDPFLGHACMMISPVTFVEVNHGGHLNGIDFVLRLSGSIAGRITDAVDGFPVPGIQLNAISDPIGIEQYGWYGYPYYYGYGFSSTPFTDQDGVYTITGLIPGAYRVQTCDPKREFIPFLYCCQS